MIGSEETQEPRELLFAHESPEPEPDVFADRPARRQTTSIPDPGTGKIHTQTSFHGENLPVKRARGTDADKFFKRRGEFLDAAAPGRHGKPGSEHDHKSGVPVSRRKFQIERAAEDRLHNAAGSNGREARAFRLRLEDDRTGCERHCTTLSSLRASPCWRRECPGPSSVPDRPCRFRHRNSAAPRPKGSGHRDRPCAADGAVPHE